MTQKEYVDSFLNDLEKVHLQKFADDDQLQAIVKKVLLGGIYANGTLKAGKDPNPLHNCAFGYLQFADSRGNETTNEQIGANIRSLYEGIKAVEYAFEIFEKYKTPDKTEEESGNNAR